SYARSVSGNQTGDEYRTTLGGYGTTNQSHGEIEQTQEQQDISNALAGHHGLAVGLVWWGFGILLAIGYFIFVYRMFRGKVAETADVHGD
ncbi:MAG: hypothetical protein V4587_17030, partial [Acidobacteriota bacterium]